MSENIDVRIEGRCVLCGARISGNGFLCNDCSSYWTIDTIFGSIYGVDELIEKEDIESAVDTPEATIISICGTMLTKNQITSIIPTTVSALMPYALNEYDGSELASIIANIARSQRARVLPALELARIAGVINDLDLSRGLVVIDDGLLNKIAKFAKVDVQNLGEKFVMNFVSGYIYLKSGVIPIYDKFLRGDRILPGDGITIIYPITRRGNVPTLRIPRGVFSIFVALLRLLERAEKDIELDESHIMYRLIMSGKTTVSEYATKVLPIIMGTDQDVAPFVIKKVWKRIDPEKRRFIFNDVLIEASDRIRERGERLREDITRQRD